MGFPRKLTIRRSSEIKEVLSEGRCLKSDLLRIHFLPAESSAPSRAAFIVPRFGNTAVRRNLLKRRLQELLRAYPGLPAGYLLVVRAAPGAYGAEFPALKERLFHILGQIDRRGQS